MEPVRILIADAVSTRCDQILTDRELCVERAVGQSVHELMERVPWFDGMIVRSAVKVDAAMIGLMGRMRAIGRAGVGVDNIDVGAATERGIVVMNTPDGNTISAAEHTMALLLALLRRIPAANLSLRSGAWDRKVFVGTELMGKKIGVIGLGRIGREVARRIGAFDTTVFGYDPMLSSEAVSELGLESLSVDRILEECDIVTLHVPLLPETRGMIGSAELGRMKKGSLIVNCARGGIVDEASLLQALNDGHIGGAAIDVFESEPARFPNELIAHPNVVATPHIAASTEEAQERVAIDIALQMAEYFEGKGARGVVNAHGLEPSLTGAAQPLMRAAELLGAVLGQLVRNHDVSCALTVYGSEATSIIRGLCASFLAGMVSLGLDESINAINATMLSERNRISLTAEGAAGKHTRYATLIEAEVSDTQECRSAAMSVFGWTEPHLVRVDDVWVDVRPTGDLVLFENVDRPGVLAAVGAVLASHGVNIASVSLGQHEQSGNALTVMRIDSELNDTALEQLAALNVIDKVRTVHLG